MSKIGFLRGSLKTYMFFSLRLDFFHCVFPDVLCVFDFPEFSRFSRLVATLRNTHFFFAQRHHDDDVSLVQRDVGEGRAVQGHEDEQVPGGDGPGVQHRAAHGHRVRNGHLPLQPAGQGGWNARRESATWQKHREARDAETWSGIHLPSSLETLKPSMNLLGLKTYLRKVNADTHRV